MSGFRLGRLMRLRERQEKEEKLRWAATLKAVFDARAERDAGRTDLEQAEKDALRGGSTRRRCRALACPRHRDGRGRAAGLVQQVAPQEVLLPGLLGCEFELVEEVLEVVCSREDR